MNAQVSLTEQLERLHALAVEHGLYDAADWLNRAVLPGRPARSCDVHARLGAKRPLRRSSVNPYQELRVAVESAKAHGTGVDPDVVLRLIGALENAEAELLPLRSIVSDLDVFMDGEEGDLFQPDHNCRPQRRLAQFRREVWKPSADERGYRQARITYGRGKGRVA